MENLHTFIETFTHTKPGIVTFCISILSTTLAFLNLHQVQSGFAICASCVAMVSGGFAIHYYRLQIKKLKSNA